jgi:PhzF family phenazine biosynthesis protein
VIATPDATAPVVLRYTAFPDPTASAPGDGGNPAGVVLDAAGLTTAEMQQIAADVGYSETAFVTASSETAASSELNRRSIRYFSPGAEVPFCGHATIATAVALAERDGTGEFTFDTSIGAVVIQTSVVHTSGIPTSGIPTSTDAGRIVAAFTSVDPQVVPIAPAVRAALMTLLSLSEADLNTRFPLLAAYAGNWHPLIFVRDRSTFDAISFDPASARRLMDAEGWAGTISVLHAVTEHEFESRNIFPVGTITEDPATGSAAASLGGYLRETGAVTAPTRIRVRQGRHVGRPSLLTVDIPAVGGIVVSGSALPISE